MTFAPRDLPPVDAPVESPRRMSMTLLRNFARCPRSSYLYLRYKGGVGSHEMDRGSAFHLFSEAAMRLLIEHGEPRMELDVAKDLVGTVLDERPELCLTPREADLVRQLAWHWTAGLDVDPQTVVGIEQMLGLELEDMPVVGKADLIYVDGDTLCIDDYKSSPNVPAQEEFEAGVQLPLYGVLLLYGAPFDEREVDGERVTSWLPPLGEGVNFVRVREVYPYPKLRDDGRMHFREVTLSRTELAEFRGDVERLVRRVKTALTDGRWPAVPGSWCSQCPARGDCPLPVSLRSWAGEVNTRDEAEEALAWAEDMDARRKATLKEVRLWASVDGRAPVACGGDVEFAFDTSESYTTDWDGLREAVERAVRFGEDFSLEDHRKLRTSTSFKRRKRAKEEVEV